MIVKIKFSKKIKEKSLQRKRKNFVEGSNCQELKGNVIAFQRFSRLQGSELPSGRNAQAIVVIVIPVVVDTETLQVEIADTDTVAD